MRPPLRYFAFLPLMAVAVVGAMAALPARPDGYVTDAAGTLSASVERTLESLMTELDRKTGAQIAVVTAASLDGRDVAEAAESLFRQWAIGRKGKDDGLLLLVSPSDRKARIEVGYGLEGLIPDGRAGRVLDEQAMPRFRAGDMEGGIVRAAVSLAGIVAADRGVRLTGAPASRPDAGKEMPLWLAILLAIVFGYFVMKHPWLLLLLLSGRGGGRGMGGGGFGGFGGFGGGSSGGGGASRGW